MILRQAPTMISLGLLALMVSGPFLLPFHTMPIVGFWSEWWAGALGLAAATTGLIAIRGRSLMLPRLLVVPAVLLLTLLIQFMLGRVAFPQVGLLYAVYLLWAGMLMVLGRHLAETIGLARLADVLAAAIALGAVIGALVALAQWLGVADRMPWIFRNPFTAISANLGQANHHAHFSWLGIASAFYLRGRHYLSRPLLWLLILLLGFGSVLSGSRSLFPYPLALLGPLACPRPGDAPGPAARLFADAAVLLPVLVGRNFGGAWATRRIPEWWTWLVSILSSPGVGGFAIRTDASDMAGARLYESVSGFSPRLAITRGAWSAFVDQPWLGQGAGNYPWASFVAAAGRVGEERFMVAEHAHNFVLHEFVEFGAPVAVALVLLLALWAKQFLRQPWRLEHAWCGAVLGIGAIHSLLEYPLWYSYFLGPTALLLGAGDSRRNIAVAGRRVTIYLVLAGLAGAVILANLRADYSKIEAASNYPLAAHPDRERAWRISMDRLLTLHRESLLSPWVLMAFTNLAEPSKQQAQERADLCERGIRFAPARSLVARCAMQLALAGRAADAQELVRAVLHAFPAERTATIDQLAKGAKEHPELVPLLAASLAKQAPND